MNIDSCHTFYFFAFSKGFEKNLFFCKHKNIKQTMSHCIHMQMMIFMVYAVCYLKIYDNDEANTAKTNTQNVVKLFKKTN